LLAWLDPQLLAQFAHKGLFRRFTRFNLAARELPQACMLFAGRALSQQDTSIRVHKRARHDEQQI
jgi:hypothetical protein